MGIDPSLLGGQLLLSILNNIFQFIVKSSSNPSQTTHQISQPKKQQFPNPCGRTPENFFKYFQHIMN
jgi:hypothetical protein